MELNKKKLVYHKKRIRNIQILLEWNQSKLVLQSIAHQTTPTAATVENDGAGWPADISNASACADYFNIKPRVWHKNIFSSGCTTTMYTKQIRQDSSILISRRLFQYLFLITVRPPRRLIVKSVWKLGQSHNIQKSSIFDYGNPTKK